MTSSADRRVLRTRLSAIMADDEAVARRLLKRNLLRLAPYVDIVGEASNGYELLSLLDVTGADILMLDIMMPGLDGLEALRRLGDKAKTMKVVIVSAHDRFDFAKEALHLGVFDYLLKPVRPAELTATINKCAFEIQKERNILSSDPLRSEGSQPSSNSSTGLGIDLNTSLNSYRVVLSAQAIMAEMYAEELTLASVAKKVFVSPWYLSRLFKVVSGLNFQDCLTKIRVEKAKGLLLNSNMPCKAVGHAVGYANPSYFSHVFKRVTGFSPIQFRSAKAKDCSP